MMKNSIVLFSFLFLIKWQLSNSQELLTDSTRLNEYSMEELLNLTVVTPSKQDQTIFESQLSVSSISYEQIISAGATSIPEALRLIPGLIVREQSPGNYDVHVRGMDNLMPNSFFYDATNSITLVIIDNRVVYNYFTGGTLWESLPISIEDIDKIEVVRGPSSVFYGPNAASGVIHFITKKEHHDNTKPIVNADIQGGQNNTLISNIYISQNLDSKNALSISTNYDYRNRRDKLYYDFSQDQYVNASEVISFFDRTPLFDQLPDTMLSRNNWGLNIGYNHRFDSLNNLQVDLGYQQSQVQNIYVDNLSTPFTMSDSKSKYVNITSKNGSLSSQLSILDGFQGSDFARGADSRARTEYDFKTIDYHTEYTKSIKRFGFRSGVYFRNALYNADFVGGQQQLNSLSVSLNSKYNYKKFSLNAGIRIDKYNHPNELYFPFVISSSYKLNESNFFRIVASESQRSPYLLHLYLDQEDYIPGFLYSQSKGNIDLGLLKIYLYEIGYRTTLLNKVYADIELFQNRITNFSELVQTLTIDSIFISESQYQNIEARAVQNGVTINLIYKSHRDFRANIFGTYQQTKVYDYQPDVSSSPDSLLNFPHRSTPNFYGGFVVDYSPLFWLHLNLNSYYYSNQIFTRQDLNFKIDSKMIMNFKMSCDINEHFSCYINVRNALNDSAREFGYADRIGNTYLLGVRFKN